MSRSLKVSPQYIKQVKLAVRRKGFARQIDLAKDLQLSRSTHEDARSRHIWKKLRLVVAHSTEVYIPLNINRFPYYPELAMAMKKVIEATSPVQLEPMEAFKLQSLGLVQLYGNDVKPRCNLSAQYFGDRLS